MAAWPLPPTATSYTWLVRFARSGEIDRAYVVGVDLPVVDLIVRGSDVWMSGRPVCSEPAEALADGPEPRWLAGCPSATDTWRGYVAKLTL